MNVLQESEDVWPLCRLTPGQSSPIRLNVFLPPLDRSREWKCPCCKQTNLELLPDVPRGESLSVCPSPSIPPTQPPTPIIPRSSHGPRQSSESSIGTSSNDQDVTIHTVHPSLPPTRTHSTMSLDSLASREEPAHPHAVHLASVAKTPVGGTTRAHRPPLLLDTAICVLLVLTFALVCRRVL